MMASTANTSSSLNNSTNATTSPASAQRDGPNRSIKQSTGNKMTDKNRKESPVDSNRRSTTTKGWSVPPTNTQRASTPTQQKGNNSQHKATPVTAKVVNSKDQMLSDQQSHDRLRFLFGGTVGLAVVLTTKAGEKFEGVFSGSSSAAAATKITLKMTKKVQNTSVTQANGVGWWEAAFAGSSPDHAMSFELKDIADMTVPEFSIPDNSKQPNGASTSFQTDSDISGPNNRGERTLQRWVPDATESTDYSLEATSTAGWDQFETHKKMTGGQSTYTEEAYTTTIDRSAPDYKRREAEAARIAREIESQPTNNMHVKEERGHTLENDYADEEDKYSGVRRSDFVPLAVGGANRYMPPALRAPTAHSTTMGVPVDSAIISAQIARPDASRSSNSNQSTRMRSDNATNDVEGQHRAGSGETASSDEAPAPAQTIGTDASTTNGAAPTTITANPMQSASPQRPTENETPSQGVENKVLDQFRQFANSERARVAERKRAQASQDRTAKFNDLVRFSKTFKLKTPIPNDLVGILAKDPRKQEQIMEKAQRDHEEAKATPTIPQSTSTATQLPSVPKFDKSQIPPPIPERNTFNNARGNLAKQSLPRAQRTLAQQLPFSTGTVPLAPRGQSSTLRDKNGPIPTPIPMPEIRSSTITSADKSGLSSPRGTDTPTSAASTKFNVRAIEFKPTFHPTAPSVSAASPSPITRTASIARSASPSGFFGQRQPKTASERLEIMPNFNPIQRMKKEVQAKQNEKSDDFAGNGGIPNAYHTKPVWIVPDANIEKKYDDFFARAVPPAASPAQSRSSSTQAVPFHGQMQQMPGGPHMPQAMTPQHGHHGKHYQPHYDDQRMHMQNGSPQVYASPSMTPRNMYASPMGHPSQGYAHQAYFGAGGPVPMRPYGNNPAMMHTQHSQMVAPMMVAQQSNGPFMGVPGSFPGMMYTSPTPGHVYPQQNGFPSPGRIAPPMMHQNSQQGHLGHQQLMYSNSGHPGGMYGQQTPMGQGYGGNHTPYGTSPHQPHHMNQRAMSSGFLQKNMSQMNNNSNNNNGPPANAPQQPAAFGQMPVSDDGK